jgi:hypothetical protein
MTIFWFRTTPDEFNGFSSTMFHVAITLCFSQLHWSVPMDLLAFISGSRDIHITFVSNGRLTLLLSDFVQKRLFKVDSHHCLIHLVHPPFLLEEQCTTLRRNDWGLSYPVGSRQLRESLWLDACAMLIVQVFSLLSLSKSPLASLIYSL